MPKLMDKGMESLEILGGKGAFNFSATRMDELGATEYTLVTIALDKSGSVFSFEKELLDALKSVIESCKKSPRAENLMIRLIEFNHKLDEVHGFKLLSNINLNDYNEPDIGGCTALYDALYSSIGATVTYAKNLTNQNFGVNGICFVITDGMDNNSKMTCSDIADYIRKVKIGESIESLFTVLIGINASECNQYLDELHNKAMLTQFVDIGAATPQKLAKLATFVSRSIVSQSQALGSGQPSQSLTF